MDRQLYDLHDPSYNAQRDIISNSRLYPTDDSERFFDSFDSFNSFDSYRRLGNESSFVMDDRSNFSSLSSLYARNPSNYSYGHFSSEVSLSHEFPLDDSRLPLESLYPQPDPFYQDSSYPLADIHSNHDLYLSSDSSFSHHSTTSSRLNANAPEFRPSPNLSVGEHVSQPEQKGVSSNEHETPTQSAPAPQASVEEPTTLDEAPLSQPTAATDLPPTPSLDETPAQSLPSKPKSKREKSKLKPAFSANSFPSPSTKVPSKGREKSSKKDTRRRMKLQRNSPLPNSKEPSTFPAVSLQSRISRLFHAAFYTFFHCTCCREVSL